MAGFSPAQQFMQLGMVSSLAKRVANAIVAGVASKPQVTAITPLTGTVGTANDAMTAIAALPLSTLATDFATQKTSIDAVIGNVNTKYTELNNDLADLQAKVNTIIAALQA